MRGQYHRKLGRRVSWWLAGIVVAACGSVQSARAQSSSTSAAQPAVQVIVNSSPAPASGSSTHVDSAVEQASCSTCGGGGDGVVGGGLFSCGCGGGGVDCYPGRFNNCCDCDSSTAFGRLFCGFYQCVCCPDPCYEGHWIAAANNAFWQDAARPITQMRLAWDSGINLRRPDRAEFFWARQRIAGGKGPRIDKATGAAFPAETGVDYNDIRLITEAAAARFSVAIDTPYRSIDPEVDPHAAGFGDMDIAAKSLIMDCDLMQVAFQFRTYIPTGNFLEGLGNGHVSLEPSLLVTLCLMHDTYLQTQIAEWIPLGGDPDYQGAILHYHTAVNRVLWRPAQDIQVVGSLEFNGWSFQEGQFTDPVLGANQKAGNHSFFNAGPGIRLVFCDKIDFGFAAAFAITNDEWPQDLFRTEFRWRF